MASARDENFLLAYRSFLFDLSAELSVKDLEGLKYVSSDFIPRRKTEDVASGFKLFDLLEQDGRITRENLSLLKEMLEAIKRADLAWKVQQFASDDANTAANVDVDVPDGGASLKRSTENGHAVLHDDVEHDGIGDEPEETLTLHDASNHKFENQEAEAVGACGVSPVSTGLLSSPPSVSTVSAKSGAQAGKSTPSTAETSQGSKYTQSGTPSCTRGPAPAPSSHSQEQSSTRLERSTSGGPAPVRYVNFLALEGYSVEILGGKHFKTPEGEFVEVKSGTQYKIHVKNSRPYGCNLDISIDGYDVGGWVVDGGEETTIERSAYEAKKFTFYRVKKAPKEAGIESGWYENGCIKCEFTPEAFVGIPVIIPDSSQPLIVNFAPSASVGDLKTEIQRQLHKSPDLDQILSLNHKVLANHTLVRNVIKTSGDLQLIDAELEITIQVSTSEVIHVSIRPGKAKVNDLMKEIETSIGVPPKDQKMYHGKTLLSDTPSRCIPLELLCSSKPTVDVIIPEYIQITVENAVGRDLIKLKIDQEKSLRDLMAEIPWCRYLENNQEAVFHVNGRELSHVKDTDTLASLGILSGSQLKVEVRVLFISVYITGLPGFSSWNRLDIQCNPEETFKDLLSHIQSRTNIKKIDGATFLMKDRMGRIFDPTEDLGSLQDYGIEHRSTLAFKMTKPQTMEEYERKRTMEDEKEEAVAKQKGKGPLQWFLNWKEKVGLSKRKESVEGPPLLLQPQGHIASGLDLSDSEDEGPPLLLRHSIETSEDLIGFRDSLDEVCSMRTTHMPKGRVLTENDPSWRAGGTTLQGHSTQHFVPADPIKVDHTKKVELVLRLVAREDETDLQFPDDECTPLSTLYPSSVPE
ncbi:uncharacterized protein [Montipora foliosa]|uniref:uncharacterized protein isoform X2 n=1 Tax=Montipora foliosa TaxID=591990 RepID=UPI0035F1A144